MTVPSLREAIDQVRANVVGSMLQAAGVVDVPKTKEGKMDLWAAVLVDKRRIQQAYERLTPRCRSALHVLLARGPGAELRTVRFRVLLAAGRAAGEGKPPARNGLVCTGSRTSADPVTFEEILAALLKNWPGSQPHRPWQQQRQARL